MTLGMSLVVFGLANAIQLLIVKTSSGVPRRRWIGSNTLGGVLPFSLRLVPLAAILIGLRRSGYGRLLYAVGDAPSRPGCPEPGLAGPDRPLHRLGAWRRSPAS